MLATVPVTIKGNLALGMPEACRPHYKNADFPKIGVPERTKQGAFPRVAKGSTHGLKSVDTSLSGSSLHIELQAPRAPSRSPDKTFHTETIGAFSLRAKSRNLAKFEKSSLAGSRGGGADDDSDQKVRLPVLPMSLAKSPHPLGRVKPQKYEQLEVFKIYKKARNTSALDRLKVIGCQGRPNTPVDHNLAEKLGLRPVSRINLPPVEVDPAPERQSFPSRAFTLSATGTAAKENPQHEEHGGKQKAPALRVMNFEPDIIPDELKATVCRTPLVPFQKPNCLSNSGSWLPSQTDKPRNILRPTGGYGKHRPSITIDPSPVAGAVQAGRIHKSLMAPHQGNTTVLRQNYAKNMEKNWLKRLHEENTRKKKDQTAVDWVQARSNGNVFNFEACFYSSADEDVDKDMYSPRLIRSCSLDVLCSDDDFSSSDENEFISIVLQDGELTDRVVRNKMRKKFASQQEKYKKIINASRELEIAEKVSASTNTMLSNRDYDPEYIGGIDGMEGVQDIDLAINEMRYFMETPTSPLPTAHMPRELETLTDKEIRAMRLKLKAKEEGPRKPELDLYDPTQFKALAAEILAGLKNLTSSNKKKKKAKKKSTRSRHVTSSGKKVKWNKQADYNEYERRTPENVTCKDQFIHDFGHWLDGRVDMRLKREKSLAEEKNKESATNKDNIDMTPNETSDSVEPEHDDRPTPPCATEIALREFNDDYSLLTDLLLDTRTPMQRFVLMNTAQKQIDPMPGKDTGTHHLKTENTHLSGMNAVENNDMNDDRLGNAKIPVVRRMSDPGLERLKQIKFTVTVSKNLPGSGKRRSRRGSNFSAGSRRSSIRSIASRRSSIRSIASNKSGCLYQGNSGRLKRPQTPGVYKLRRRVSSSHLHKSPVSDTDETMSIKSASSTRSTKSARKARSSRKASQSPQKRSTNILRSQSTNSSASSIKQTRQSTTSASSTRQNAFRRSSSISSSTSCSLYHIEEEEYIIDLDDLDSSRPSSARGLKHMEPEIDLWDLTKGLDFPAKEVKIKIVNRKRRRQRKKRLMNKQAEIYALQKANKLAENILSGHPLDSKVTGDDSEMESSSDESEDKNSESERPKQMTFGEDSPFVSACIAWKTSSRRYLKLTNEELDAQIAQLGSLFQEMRECRYIRWSARDWAIIERLYELELLDW